MADGKFTQEVKELILKRTGWRCDRCGLRAEYPHFHHRTPRRSGGTSRDDLGWPSNGLLLHPSCHDYIEARRKVAAQLGFLVGYGRLPHEAPVMLWSGWHLLTPEGQAVPLRRVPPLHPDDGPPSTPDG